MSRNFDLKLAKPAPIFGEPRPQTNDAMRLHLVSSEADKNPLTPTDPLHGYRDRRHSRDSVFFQESSDEQFKANELNANHIP